MRAAMTMVLGVGLSIGLSACGGGELGDWGCHSDAECKHGRICVDGACRDAGSVCRDDADCPSGQHCYGGSCIVCDADGDGALGAQCAGEDCDDGDPAVHPDARELCGDGLDNDCDGATDPEDLCAERCQGVECPEGWACDPDTGQCVPICEPDCSGRECGPDGCGGSCGECPAGQRCDREGRCVAGCEDRCQAGATACAGGGVTTCRDTDGDGCVEWSQPEACPPGTRCVDGACVGGCEHECERGRTECVDEIMMAECGQYDDDECWEWGPPVPCQSGWCDPELGRCADMCEDECQWDESRCADQRSVQRCGQFDPDPCLEFGPPEPCPDNTRCDPATGRCGGGPCEDECWQPGQPECSDEFGFIECGDFDADPCLEYSPRQPCPEGQRCDWDTGHCDPTCVDECWWGESVCVGDFSYTECGQWDDDICLEFGPTSQCPEDQPCADGRCGGCTDECGWGERYCWDEYGYVECGEWDGDPCLEFSPRQSCPEGTMCDWGSAECVAACQDECPWGAWRCINERRYRICDQFDDDPCSEWGPRERCRPQTFCSEEERACVAENCRDECQPGEQYCWDEWSMVECGQYDQDPCLEFSPPLPCPPEQPCDWQTGACGACWPTSCDELGVECGWWPDGCGDEMYCGDCPADEVCSDQGRCQAEGGREGAGAPCGLYQGCPADWYAAWTCIEYPGSTEGFCSYPCQTEADCQIDFPGGCCRELADGHRVCLPDPDLCTYQGNGYQQECTWGDSDCLPDMFCIEDYQGSGESYCLLTCDRAMGICPLGGSCLGLEDGDTATGLCLPTGDGQFADVCGLLDGCVNGLVCLAIDEEHPGYCNTMCSDMVPCPDGFECLLDDGSGGRWCAELCFGDDDCARLGDWECVFFGGQEGICLPQP